MDSTAPVFYCPYDLAIQTMDAIASAQLQAIEELKNQGLSQDDVDFLMQ